MKQERRYIVDILFVLALFGVFAISALVVVVIGADVYKHTMQSMSDNYDSRTAIAYVSEKVRQADSLTENGTSAVEISHLGDNPALVLHDDKNGEEFCTWLYYHDGWLKELYTRKDADLGGDILAAGEDILQLSELEYSMISDDLLSVSMTLPSGKEHNLYLTLRCH